jgi:hypothetical protein
MSIDVMTITRGGDHVDVSGFVQKGDSPVSVDFGHEETGFDPLWKQVEDILKTTLGQTYIQKPEVSTIPPQSTDQMYIRRVLVAPNVSVRFEEYEQRYGGIDLEQLRQRMAPELYKAFVRHIGSIPGDPDLDINEITNIPE